MLVDRLAADPSEGAASLVRRQEAVSFHGKALSFSSSPGQGVGQRVERQGSGEGVGIAQRPGNSAEVGRRCKGIGQRPYRRGAGDVVNRVPSTLSESVPHALRRIANASRNSVWSYLRLTIHSCSSYAGCARIEPELQSTMSTTSLHCSR